MKNERSPFSLEGKAVVVTGGGRGIGRGIVRAMARAGADVVVSGRAPGPLEEAAAEARAFGVRAIAVPADVTLADDRERLAAKALEAFGYVDCWVNNAGSAAKEDVDRLLDLNEAQWDRVVDVNLKATF